MNNDIIIGVDYSINSPAICIYKNNNYQWVSYTIPNKTKKDRLLQDELSKLSDINIKINNYIIPEENYENTDVYKVIKYDIQAGTLLQLLKYSLGVINQNNNIKLAFEGYSFGSRFQKTDNIIDISAATTLFKKYVLNEILTSNEMYKVISPKTIKMLAGNGKLDKRQLFDIFINNNLNDIDLEKSCFWQYCKTLKIGKKVPSPIDDMIDSYFIIRALLS